MSGLPENTPSSSEAVPRYRVRRVNNGPSNMLRGRIYDVEATPAGAMIPAFRVRAQSPIGLMSEMSWPSVVLTNEPRMDAKEARLLVARADRLRWARSGEGPRAGGWVASTPGDDGQHWPVDGAEARRALMDVQWLAQWFRELVAVDTLHRVYALIGAGDPCSALEALARAVCLEEVEVPRRHAFTLQRLGSLHGVDARVLEAVYERVPEDDQAWAWAHTLNLPKVRQRWLTEEQGQEHRFMEVECTPPGERWPEWTKRVNDSPKLIEPLLGTEFQGELKRAVLREYDGGLYKWQSLCAEDLI